MKFLLASVFAFFACFTSSNAQQGMGESSLAKDIILFEANSYRVVTEFNVYAMQKDKRSEQRLFDVLEKGDKLSGLFEQQSSSLAPSWDKYRSFSWEKHNQADGDIDTYVFNDMRILHKGV